MLTIHQQSRQVIGLHLYGQSEASVRKQEPGHQSQVSAFIHHGLLNMWGTHHDPNVGEELPQTAGGKGRYTPPLPRLVS